MNSLSPNASGRIIQFLALLLLAAGCARGPRQLSLRDAPEPPPAEASADDIERHRLELMQTELVWVTDDAGNKSSLSAKDLYDRIVPDDAVMLGGDCGRDIVCRAPNAFSPCADEACRATVHLCGARILQSAALIRAQPIRFTAVDNTVYEIPAQAMTTKAALLREALRRVELRLNRISTSNVCWATSAYPGASIPNFVVPASQATLGPAQGTLFAEAMVDAFNLAQSLASDTVDALVAVADKRRSEEGGVDKSMSDILQSRAEAAQLLIGTHGGYGTGNQYKALCNVPELTGRGRRALEMIRRAAPSPAMVKGPLTTDQFLNGSPGATTEGSVAVRLAYLDGFCNGTTCTYQDLEKQTGISTEDFTQARAYLSQEVDAFARSSALTFTPTRVINSTTPPPALSPTPLFYAATRNEPSPPPSEYYASIVRFVQTNDVGKTTAPASGDIWIDLARNLNDAITNIRANQTAFVTYVKNTPGCPSSSCPGLSGSFSEQWKLIDGTISGLLSDDPRRGVFFVNRVSSTQTGIRAYGYSSADKITVVKGLDGLLCATTGTLEGQPCTSLTPYTITTLAADSATAGYGYSKYTLSLINTTLIPDSTTPVFAVRPRNPAQAVPGGFEYLTGVTLKGTVTGTSYAFPMIPELDRKAGEIIRPSHRWCSRPAVECDGTKFDERLPLENELSEDNDGVESSWKHYLTLAEQAAAESDALGADLIENGLEVDRQEEMTQIREFGDQQRFLTRADAELETVQDICGTAMSTEELLGEVGFHLWGFAPDRTKTCVGGNYKLCCDVTQTDCAHVGCTGELCVTKSCAKKEDCCIAGQTCKFDCLSGQCSRTIEGILSAPTTNQNLSRIQECLGAQAIAPYAVIGTDPLCIWTNKDNPNLLCDGASAQFPCPQPVSYQGSTPVCTHITNLPAVASTPFAVDRFPSPSGMDVKLGLVDSTLSASWDPCGDLRKLRHGGSKDTLCSGLQYRPLEENSFFGEWGANDDDAAAQMSARYTYSTSAGQRVDVLEDSSLRFSTACPAVNTVWPAVGINSNCASTTPNSLFCQTVVCNPATAAEFKQMATLNQRLIEAAVILKSVGLGDYDKITVPQWWSPTDYAQVQDLKKTYAETSGATLREDLTFIGSPGSTFSRDELTLASRYVPSGAAGTLPVFFKHFATGSSVATDYTINSTTPGVLAPLPSNHVEPGSIVESIRTAAAVCGSIASADYANIANPLPIGVGGTATEQQLNDRAVPDLPYLTTRFRYDDQGIQDAAELLCELQRANVWSTPAGASCPGLFPETLTKKEDFAQVRNYARCKVADFARTIGKLLLPRIPTRVIQGIHDSAQGGFPIIGGEIGGQMHRLRAALIRFGELGTSMGNAAGELADTVDDMSLTIQQLDVRTEAERLAAANAQLRGTQARIKMNQLDFQQQAGYAKSALDCQLAFMKGGGNAIISLGGSLFDGAAECFAAIAAEHDQWDNLNYEKQITEVEATIAQNDEEAAELDEQYVLLEHARDMIRQRAKLREVASRMANLTLEARASIEEITASLSDIEGLRLKALRAISRATQYQSTATSATRHIDSVLDAKLYVSRQRYQRAHKNAIRLAFLAKRAIEQRLGMHLSELTADLPLVEAPANWESTVCTLEGIDYSTLQSVSGTVESKDFAEAFVGDYVGKLKNVVESYRLEFDFQEGTDEVVASVRDDVFGTRQVCEVPMGNLLTYSGNLNHMTTDLAQPGWVIQGCSNTNGVSSDCLKVAPYVNTPLAAGAFGSVPGFLMAWGSQASPSMGERLVQRVKLSPGRYRLSWYSPEVSLQPELDGGLYDEATNAAVTPVSGGSTATNPGGSASANRWSIAAENSYMREYRFFDVPLKANYLVKVISAAVGSDKIGLVAGFMLEKLTALDAKEDPVQLPYLKPAPYVATAEDTTHLLKACADSDGSAFRADAWTRHCQKLCKDGYSGNCEHSERVDSCYWETLIGLDQRDLEEGRIFEQAGFAAGNFNYRIEDIAVNFVGSAVRDCEGVEDPEACYAGGFVPYSLTHLGPYFVRNHEGADFSVKLFTGNIEHARGLGLERYLTNPLSSTDRELLTPYVRTEFQGRPLDGSFLLRVWDAPGVDFSAIEDVQLYIKYRYWTRNQ